MLFVISPRHALRRFVKDEDASLSVELVLILPLLIWGFLTVITVFDVFRARNLALKGNYAISDLLSRENNAIDSAYLTGVDKIYSYLTQGGDSTWVRVTSVVCVADCGSNEDRVLNMVWSRATDAQPAYTQTQMRNTLGPIIPLLPSNQYAFVVETSVDYTPPFIPPTLGAYIDDRDGQTKQMSWGIMRNNTFRDTVVTEPRFGPQLCFSGVTGC